MELKYRSISYKQNPPTLELTTGETGGKYRGANWNHHYLRHIPVPQPVANLKYRGVTYCTGDPVDVEASQLRRRYTGTVVATSKPTLQNTQPQAKSRREVMDELNNIHLNNIRRNLEHRLQVARAKGDRHLVQMLEAEVEQIV